jgi:hypothetical protein
MPHPNAWRGLLSELYGLTEEEIRIVELATDTTK